MGTERKVKRVNGILVQKEEQAEAVDCLGHCGKQFVPEFKYNRVCPSCTKHNEGLNGKEFGVAGKVKVVD